MIEPLSFSFNHQIGSCASHIYGDNSLKPKPAKARERHLLMLLRILFSGSETPESTCMRVSLPLLALRECFPARILGSSSSPPVLTSLSRELTKDPLIKKKNQERNESSDLM